MEWGRKGTPKILDIKLEYPKFYQKKLELNQQDKTAASIIFDRTFLLSLGVNQAFREGKKVELVKTEKVNGEHAQVSYSYDFDAWLICSKNVSVLAETVQDLSMYKGNRYKFAITIAQQWFSEIKNLSSEEIKNLKKLLDGYTIIGEYCGNPIYQHLVKY